MTDDLAHVRAVLRDARPGFEKTRYAPALQLAGDALAAVPAGTKTLAWMADEQRLGWLGVDLKPCAARRGEGAPRAACPVHRVGRRRSSPCAVWGPAAADARPGVAATVRLFAPEQDRRRIAVIANGQTLAEQTVSCTRATTRWNCVSPCRPTRPACAFPWSNRTICPPTTPPGWRLAKPAVGKVFLDAAPGTDFLAHALRSTQRLEAGGLEPAPLPDGPWPLDAVAVVRGAGAFRPPQAERSGTIRGRRRAGLAVRRWVRRANRLAAKSGIGVTPRDPAPDGGAEHLRDWDPDHPILAAFAGQSLLPLLNVEFYRGFDLEGGALSAHRQLARRQDGAGRMERRRPAHPPGRIPLERGDDQLARPTLFCPVRASGGALAGIGGRGAARLAGGRRDPAAARRRRVACPGRRIADCRTAP